MEPATVVAGDAACVPFVAAGAAAGAGNDVDDMMYVDK